MNEYKRMQSNDTLQGPLLERKMSKTVTLRLDDEVYEELKAAAEADRRPLSNLIETAALARIREQQFVDDAEMAEILSNERLLERMKAGSKDAKARRGEFVD